MAKQPLPFLRSCQWLPCTKRLQVSLETYMFNFTCFHLLVVVFAVYLSMRNEASHTEDLLQMYCNFPLGVFVGEKLMTVWTGYLPWIQEWRAVKDKYGQCWAMVG